MGWILNWISLTIGGDSYCALFPPAALGSEVIIKKTMCHYVTSASEQSQVVVKKSAEGTVGER